jgi:thioredoxin reductase (NADPH)
MYGGKIFDLVIIGSGPAGLSASIYASRYGVEHVLVGGVLGGQISETHEIDNYPGIENISGFEFGQRWGNHAKKYGVEIVTSIVDSIVKNENVFILAISNEKTIKARTVLLATGTHRRKLAIAGEKALLGKGVSYCATCDGFFYKNKVVGIIGGSDSAVAAATYLGGLCDKVYLIYRGEELRAEPYWISEIDKNEKIEIIFKTNVVEILGEKKVEEIILDNKYKNSKKLKIEGLFIEAGSVPNIDYATDLGVKLNEKGFIEIEKNCATNINGVFSAGDITTGSDGFCQVITAAAEGAIAARAIYQFLKKSKK